MFGVHDVVKVAGCEAGAEAGEVEFRGKENRKIQYAVLCSAAIAGGLEPNLLDQVIWWSTDDFWR